MAGGWKRSDLTQRGGVRSKCKHLDDRRSLNTARYVHSATLLPSGKVLIAGGWGASGSSTEVYYPIANTWTPGDPLNIARFSHTATLLPNGKVLVAQGRSPGYESLASVELYDPDMDTWTSLASLNIARVYHTATLLPSGSVLVTGGFDGSNSLASAEVYDPGTNTWTTVASLETSTLRSLTDAIAERKGAHRSRTNVPN